MLTRNKIILMGILVFVVIGTFPPWKYVLKTRGGEKTSPAGYALMLSPPQPANTYYSVHIDWSRLILQWVIVAAITGGACLLSPTWTPSKQRALGWTAFTVAVIAFLYFTLPLAAPVIYRAIESVAQSQQPTITLPPPQKGITVPLPDASGLDLTDPYIDQAAGEWQEEQKKKLP